MIACESFLTFTLPEGSRHHEEVNPGNTGVDFEIAAKPAIWLEVKNWDAPVIPASERPRVIRDFIDKTKSTSSFWDDLLRKFEGTQVCLETLHQRPHTVVLALMLESQLMSGIARATMISILEARIAQSSIIRDGQVVILRAAELEMYIAEASAIPCASIGTQQFVCATQVDRCSDLRRRHLV